MSGVRAHLWIRGHVQGVFYRASLRRTAAALGVGGWVRNLSDGSVEVLLEGESDAVASAVVWARRGPPFASVSEVEERDEPYSGEFRDFEVL